MVVGFSTKLMIQPTNINAVVHFTFSQMFGFKKKKKRD